MVDLRDPCRHALVSNLLLLSRLFFGNWLDASQAKGLSWILAVCVIDLGVYCTLAVCLTRSFGGSSDERGSVMVVLLRYHRLLLAAPRGGSKFLASISLRSAVASALAVVSVGRSMWLPRFVVRASGFSNPSSKQLVSHASL